MKVFLIYGTYRDIGGKEVRRFYEDVCAYTKQEALDKLVFRLGSNNIKVHKIFSFYDQQPVKYKEGF